jgi:hypothetical protein
MEHAARGEQSRAERDGGIDGRGADAAPGGKSFREHHGIGALTAGFHASIATLIRMRINGRSRNRFPVALAIAFAIDAATAPARFRRLPWCAYRTQVGHRAMSEMCQ